MSDMGPVLSDKIVFKLTKTGRNEAELVVLPNDPSLIRRVVDLKEILVLEDQVLISEQIVGLRHIVSGELS